MGKYRIHLSLLSGKKIYSDPFPFEGDEWTAEQAEEVMEGIMESVCYGAPLVILVDGMKRNYLNHAIESLWWTDGS